MQDPRGLGMWIKDSKRNKCRWFFRPRSPRIVNLFSPAIFFTGSRGAVEAGEAAAAAIDEEEQQMEAGEKQQGERLLLLHYKAGEQ